MRMESPINDAFLARPSPSSPILPLLLLLAPPLLLDAPFNFAPTEAVKRYLSGEGAGPDRNYLQFSDLSPYNNPWNRAVASELARILSLRQKGKNWRLSDGRRVSAASVAYWEDAVLEKFSRVRPGWLKTMCQDIIDPSSRDVRKESQAETDAQRFEQEEQHRIARQRKRRSKVHIYRCDKYHTLLGQGHSQRWKRRKFICEMRNSCATGPFDRNGWTQFLDIIETLGKAGMSSDESASDEATHRPCYRIRALFWRHDFDAIMDKIDAERLGPESGFSSRGSIPTPRLRQTRDLASPSHRPPTTNLPIEFYDDEWLEGRTEEYVEKVLCVSREAYQWVVGVANSYRPATTRVAVRR